MPEFYPNTTFYSDEERDYYSVVGRFVTTWASIEMNLDLLISHIWIKDTTHSIEPQRPRALKRKIRYLRKAATLLVWLSDEKEEIFAICDALTDHLSFRHDVIHGVNMNFRKVSPYFSSIARNEPGSDPDLTPKRTLDKIKVREEVEDISLIGMGLFAVWLRANRDLIESLRPAKDKGD